VSYGKSRTAGPRKLSERQGRVVNGATYDHHDVGWRLRMVVAKGRPMGVLIDLLARQFAAQDLSEDAVAIVDYFPDRRQSEDILTGT
jgi:hypothetical protein